jgi:hypothetical protein
MVLLISVLGVGDDVQETGAEKGKRRQRAPGKKSRDWKESGWMVDLNPAG